MRCTKQVKIQNTVIMTFWHSEACSVIPTQPLLTPQARSSAIQNTNSCIAKEILDAILVSIDKMDWETLWAFFHQGCTGSVHRFLVHEPDHQNWNMN